jgi:hypothetical protein
MDFTGRPLKGMVYVAVEGLRTDAALTGWIRRGLSFVSQGGQASPRRRPPSSSSTSTRTRPRR